MVFLFMILAGVNLESGWRTNLSDHDLYRSRTLAVTPTGIVATIDRDAVNVMLLDKDGKFIKRFGVSGQGPGELQAPTEIVWSKPDQALVIMDAGNSRLSWWRPEGEFLKEHSYIGNRFLIPRLLNSETAFLALDSGALNGVATLVRFNLATSEQQQIWEYSPEKSAFTNAGDQENPLRVLFRWDPQLVYDLGSNFLALTFGDTRDFQILGLSGEKQLQVKVVMEQYPVSDEQIEEGIGHLPASLHDRIRRGLVKPDKWPFISAIHVDPSDRIWVFGGAPEVGAPHPFRVYNREGMEIGAGKVPDVPMDVTDKGLYYLTKDSNADQWLGVVWYHFDN